MFLPWWSVLNTICRRSWLSDTGKMNTKYSVSLAADPESANCFAISTSFCEAGWFRPAVKAKLVNSIWGIMQLNEPFKSISREDPVTALYGLANPELFGDFTLIWYYAWPVCQRTDSLKIEYANTQLIAEEFTASLGPPIQWQTEVVSDWYFQLLS